MFKGLSTLREAEKAKQPPPEVSEKAKALQVYLASKYTDGGEGAKKKKKKKKPKIADETVIRIVDEDVSGFVAPEAHVEEEEQDEGPIIANPEEAERALRFKEQEQKALKAWETVDAPGARRARHDSSPDLSPPRRARHDSSPDLSPPRRARHDSSPDLSPPRRKARNDSPDLSPPRRARHNSSPDLSPPRRARHDSSPDLSPPRRKARNDSPDLSPPRKPPTGAVPPARANPTSGATTMADGRRGGIVQADELMEEVRQKKAEDAARFAALGDEVTGRGATTVYRDADGRVVDAETAAAAGRRGKVKKKAEFEGEKDLAWGGGLAQKRAREEAAARMRADAAKPFARTRDDAELNDAQRTRSRWGDPLAGLRKPTAAAAPDDAPVLLPRKHAKKARFIVPQEVPPHSWMRRNLPAAPNRYNIKPGRHWDGVDRSNGFERDMFKMQNARQARQAEDYAMAAMDM